MQGQEGYQLTWMDAKVDDWVVTPRRGKAVEINALWYNALRLLEALAARSKRTEAKRDGIAEHAEQVPRTRSIERFWYEQGGYLYDVVDAEGGGDDPALRPNQLFAISLEHPILDESQWEAGAQMCAANSCSRRSDCARSAPGDKDYKPRYDGDLRSRDAAYHQGTVWAWLIGPFIDAWLKVHPGDVETRTDISGRLQASSGKRLRGVDQRDLRRGASLLPRGCCAQAWSVAEVLRCFVKTSPRAESPEAKSSC